MNLNGGDIAYVLFRPGVEEFLRKMADHFELVIFTAGLKPFASHIIRRLDYYNQYGFYSFFREHCTEDSGQSIKDLTLLGRDLKDVILIDNMPVSYSKQKRNGLPIASWYS